MQFVCGYVIKMRTNTSNQGIFPGGDDEGEDESFWNLCINSVTYEFNTRVCAIPSN